VIGNIEDERPRRFESDVQVSVVLSLSWPRDYLSSINTQKALMA
jgi:hypothetical protein